MKNAAADSVGVYALGTTKQLLWPPDKPFHNLGALKSEARHSWTA